MSRVAQLDSQELQNQLHTLIWSDFDSHIKPSKNKDEYKLLIDTLVFYFGSHFFNHTKSTVTYGSQLSGISFTCRKTTVFLVTILANYLHSRISTIIFNSNSQTLLTLYRIFSKIYTCLDLLNFAHFLLSGSLNISTFLSPLHRICQIASKTDTNQLQYFYQDTVYAGIKFQNRQLLWNAILQLFNVTLLNNTTWFKTKPKIIQHTQTEQKTTSCPHCAQFPVNPYQTACCNKIYCYVCVVTALECSQCDHCGMTKNLNAKPFYEIN